MSIAATSSTMMSYMPIASTQQTSALGKSGGSVQPIDGASRPPKGADMRQKLQDMLDQQVNAGTITQDQALAINDFFAKVAAKGGPNGGPGGDNDGDNDQGAKDGPGGAEGPGGVGRRGPPPPPPPPSADQASSTDSSSNSTLADALDAFIKAIKDSQAKTTSYSAASTATITAQNSTALVVDKQV